MVSFRNFGRNVQSKPDKFYRPGSEAEVLKILEKHRGQRIRAVGRMHSWSEILRGDQVLVDLRELRQVTAQTQDGQTYAVIGAGCQIKHAISALRSHGLTLPSIGLITEQAVAGAISTGTHGSGKHCLSHYVRSLRVAFYDHGTGQPTVRTIEGGDLLRAAKCSLGALGIILSITMDCRPDYRVEEFVRKFDRLEPVLECETEFPLQQFYLMPWLWKFYAQHRREVDGPSTGWHNLYQCYWFFCIDIGLHLLILLFARHIRFAALRRFFFQHILPLTVVQNWHVTDRADRILTMQHAAFRHIEMELFVDRTRLADAIEFIKQSLCFFDGSSKALPVEDRITEGLQTDFQKCHGTYTHHYPICIRRVLPDNTMLSMSSGKEVVYSISLISYQRISDRTAYMNCMRQLARAASILFDARPHWGKLCPLQQSDFARLYPELDTFGETCRQIDPERMFSNQWICDKLLSPGPLRDGTAHAGPS